ncbi:MAG: HD domain-containing protein [Chloroflexi bacterium]|nr:HD domain-containing protein [Chloroflexota bacterium]
MSDQGAGVRRPDVAHLVSALHALIEPAGRLVVERAYLLAAAAHDGQVRDEGAPYIIHPVRVALTLAEHGHADVGLLAAALLHDTLEDTALPESEIAAAFSLEVVALVRALTRPPRHVPERAAIYHRQLREAPPAARILKVADRLDNLSYLHLSPKPGKAERYLRETELEVLPLAREVGGSLGAALMARWRAGYELLGLTPAPAAEDNQP